MPPTTPSLRQQVRINTGAAINRARLGETTDAGEQAAADANEVSDAQQKAAELGAEDVTKLEAATKENEETQTPTTPDTGAERAG